LVFILNKIVKIPGFLYLFRWNHSRGNGESNVVWKQKHVYYQKIYVIKSFCKQIKIILSNDYELSYFYFWKKNCLNANFLVDTIRSTMAYFNIENYNDYWVIYLFTIFM